MNQLVLIKAWAKKPADKTPFEYELRVVDGHLELWRFDMIWNDHSHNQFRRKGRLKMRAKGSKLPRKHKFLAKRPYRFILKKLKAQWKEDGCASSWACRFDAFAIVESGVLQEKT